MNSKDQLTVLIPTSPIPSHPSTAILDETIANIRKYTDAKIIIMFDGVHESLKYREEAYKQYQQAVITKKEDYGDCTVMVFTEHMHQSQMTYYVLQHMVTTPLIMFCEHDTSPIGEIPLKEICQFINEQNDINCLRFNIFHEIPAEHEYLMLDHCVYHVNDDVSIKYRETIQYSQRPHVAKTMWYLKILGTYFEHKKSMIEDVMHSVVIESYKALGYDTFGLAIYTPYGNQLRSYHSDGRGTDQKIIEA